MAIITRPIKTGGGTDYVPGNDELAAEFNADANTIYTDYNGNITDANCSATMGLQGTKLADAPSGVPTAKINDLAITTAKINDGAVTTAKLADANITTVKILDGNVTAPKLSVDVVVASKLKTTTFNQVISGNLLAATQLSFDTALGNTVKPLCLYLEGTSTVLNNNVSDKSYLTLMIQWNTTTNTWWIRVGNPTGNTS